ncbi:MAG: hypothetical protein JWO83_174 [Caulobacteraceae bacterium]|jgi:hypothetical protein|nr:hypothetical protein [Caulobacteraceae bacterium]
MKIARPSARDYISGPISLSGSNALWSMAYCSRMSAPLSDDELAKLAIHADERNQTLGIVGILFVAGNRFLQVLEGDRGAVRWLYDQIAEDTRHRRMTKLMDMPIEQRAFGGWSMRLICETDVAETLRMPVLEALESAAVLDADEGAGWSGLGELRACPAALVSGILGRRGKFNRLATAGDLYGT